MKRDPIEELAREALSKGTPEARQEALDKTSILIGVQRALTCQDCGAVLDAPDTVVSEDKRARRISVNCGDCSDRLLERLRKKFGFDSVPALVVQLEAEGLAVIDGRKLAW